MKKFLISVAATMVGGFLLFFFGSAMIAGAFESASLESGAVSLDEYVLVLDSGVATSETGSVPDPIAALQGNYQSSVALRKLLEAIEFAAEDDDRVIQ